MTSLRQSETLSPSPTAGHVYTIHGLVLSSEVDLPLPRITPRAADVAYRVALGDEPLPPARHSRQDDPDDPSVIERWVGDRLTVEFPDWATFGLSRDDVVLLTDETDDPDLLAHLLLDHVLPRVVSLRGDLMLHGAGAVGPSERAHIFLGETGAGKSTLVTALGARGWRLLDDDGIRVAGGHRFHAVPGSASVRLYDDAAAAVLPPEVSGRPVSRGSAKRRIDVDGQLLLMWEDPAPIVGIYLLRRDEELTLVQMGLADAIGTIAAHGFHLADEPSTITRRVFEQASALAATTPVWLLSYHHGLGNLGATIAMLEEVDGRA